MQKNSAKYIVNGKQVVTIKSIWPKAIAAALITITILYFINKVQPNISNVDIFLSRINSLFKLEDMKVGIRTQTPSETVSIAFELLFKTIAYSLLGTLIGIGIALPISLLSSSNVVGSKFIYIPFRWFMSLLRAVPPIIYAFLMFNLFSQSLSATLALGIFVSTMMAKWLFEELDTFDMEPYESMQAFGMTKKVAIIKAILPYLMSRIVSYGVYAFEIVVRFAGILGFVGIATIGTLFQGSYRLSENWGHMGIAIIILILFIIMIEVLTRMLRKYVLDYKPKQNDLTNVKKEDQIQHVIDNGPKIWIVKSIIGVLFFGLLIYSISSVEWSMASSEKIKSFKSGWSQLWNPDWSFITKFGTGENAIELAFEAVMVAGVSVVIGLILSFIFGLLASRNITNKYVSWIFKILIISIRSIPVYVWAILLIVLSPGNNFLFAGALALGIQSIGMLGKLTYEKVESIDEGGTQAMEVFGATKPVMTRWAVISEIIPNVLSNALYRWEINFKQMVQIGVVGASTFGFQVAIYAGDPAHYDKLGAYLIVTVVFVLILEQISNTGRRYLMTGKAFGDNFIKQWIIERKKYTSLVAANAFNIKYNTNKEVVKYCHIVSSEMKKEDKEKWTELMNKSKIEVDSQFETIFKKVFNDQKKQNDSSIKTLNSEIATLSKELEKASEEVQKDIEKNVKTFEKSIHKLEKINEKEIKKQALELFFMQKTTR